jgi:hypothetical protein
LEKAILAQKWLASNEEMRSMVERRQAMTQTMLSKQYDDIYEMLWMLVGLWRDRNEASLGAITSMK